MNLANNKNYRTIKDAIEAKGISVISEDNRGGGKLCLLVERAGVKAKVHIMVSNHMSGRVAHNIVRDCRTALRDKGAVFTSEEMAENNAIPPAVELAPPSVSVRRRYAVPRHNTRLTMQEKADFFALVKSGQPFLEVCDAYKFSTQAGGVLVADGEAGRFDQWLPDEYKAGKPVEQPPERSTVVAFARSEAFVREAPRFKLIAEPETPPPAEPAAVPRISPLDPRLLAFHQEHDLLQGHAAEFKRLAAELGINARVVVDVDWT